MNDYASWQQLSEGSDDPRDRQMLEMYLQLETSGYDQILSQYPQVISGTVSSVADELGFGRQPVIFMGFLEGMNTSLKTPLELETLEPESEISLDLDFEKLYRKMNEADADWLYKLDSWELVLPLEQRQAITREWRESKIIRREKVGRNDPCPCGSGKKHKKCCGKGGSD